MNRDELLELIPAYAIDALDEDERIAVEALLVDDAEAQALLREYEAVAAIMPLAVSQRPAPTHLQADLKARLATRQQSADKNTHVESVEEQSQPTASTKPRILPFPTSILATAAAAIVVIVIGLTFILSRDTNPNVNPNELAYNQIIQQEGAQHFTITPDLAQDVTGELVVAADGSQAILLIESLPDRDDSESYQLWVITDDEQVHSAGVFHWPDGHGPYYIPIEHSIEELAALGMTMEPYDGSPLGNAPTGERLFAVAVASAQ